MSAHVDLSFESSDLEESDDRSDTSAGSSNAEDGDNDDGDIATKCNTENDVPKIDRKESTGLANVMAKILSKTISDNRVILAKGKTDKEILKRKSEAIKSDEEQDDDSKKKKEINGDELEKDDFLLEQEKRLKKKKWENMSRNKPTITERALERSLQKIATCGVVQLFNAVQKQQKVMSDKLQTVGPSLLKQDQVLRSVDKGKFLDVLKIKSSKITPTEANSAQSSEKTKEMDADETKPSWSILRDDFMMGAKMKDWDKESSGESDSNVEEVHDDSET